MESSTRNYFLAYPGHEEAECNKIKEILSYFLTAIELLHHDVAFQNRLDV